MLYNKGKTLLNMVLKTIKIIKISYGSIREIIPFQNPVEFAQGHYPFSFFTLGIGKH